MTPVTLLLPGHASCRRCRHPLTAAASVRRGIGPVCIRHAAQPDNLADALVDLAARADEAANTLADRTPAELAQLAVAVDVLAAFLGGDPR